MKTKVLWALVAAVVAVSYGETAGSPEVVKALDRMVAVRARNVDPAKVGAYALEDPLTFFDGRKVATAADWPTRRREILGVFAREMYGAEPPRPEAVVTDLVGEKTTAAGFATLRQYAMRFRTDRSGPVVNWAVWTPRHAKGRVPVVLFLNYRGNYELVRDPELPVMTAWTRARPGAEDHAAGEGSRGTYQDDNGNFVFPLQMLLARGYAVMSACYCEVSPDPEADEKDPRYRQDVFAYTGVFDLWGKRDPARDDNTTALGAWAWALSRGLDLAERLPEIDAKRCVVTGFSRLGKAALLAAARDERFAVCVPVQTGGGGAPLAKRDFGENVSTENRMFTHWYCRAYAKYAADPAKLLTFDQHLLLACLAPRAVLVCGFEKKYPPWFDPEGEYLALKAASPAWRFLCGGGLPNVPYPDEFDTSAIGLDVGYVRRGEGHGISGYDWKWMLDFADRALGPERETRRWQRAIDAAANAGGGRVTVSAGEHLVGQLELKSNVELHLERGAVLRGASDPRAYRSFTLPYSEGAWSAVVVACGATNVAVTGEGTVWGDGTAWPQPAAYGNNQEGDRARGMLFADCRDVRLEDFTLRDAACWGIVLKCCDGVTARRVKIDSHANANNDGFDIEARNVLIEDCDVDSGDDAFCVKSNDPHFAVENVLVRNCTGRSQCACFKLGTASHGTMRNVRFEKCRAAAPRRDFASRRCADGTWFGRLHANAALFVCCIDGGTVEDVAFRDIELSGAAMPILVRAGRRPRRANGAVASDVHVLRNVTFENVSGSAVAGGVSVIAGLDDFRPENIVLRNVRLRVPGGVTERAAAEPPACADLWPSPDFPASRVPAFGLWALNVTGLKTDAVEFALASGVRDVRPPVVDASSEGRGR